MHSSIGQPCTADPSPPTPRSIGGLAPIRTPFSLLVLLLLILGSGGVGLAASAADPSAANPNTASPNTASPNTASPNTASPNTASLIAGPAYEIIDLAAALPFPTTDSVAFEVSDTGLIVGIARDSSGRYKSILWSFEAADVLSGTDPVLVATVLNPDFYDGRIAVAVSDEGVVVGQDSGAATGWAWFDGEFECIPLPAPCGSIDNLWRASAPRDINDFNVFTGGISPDVGQHPDDPVVPYRAVTFDRRESTIIERLESFEGRATFGNAINRFGIILAVAGSSLVYDAVLYNYGPPQLLPTQGGDYNWPTALNDEIIQGVGFVSDPGETQWPYSGTAALWGASFDPVTLDLLGRLAGYPIAWPHDINNTREIVGTARRQTGDHLLEERAILWIGEPAVDLTPLVLGDDNASGSPSSRSQPSGNQLSGTSPSWTLQSARGINDSGWIVGEGVRDNISERRRAFLLIPHVNDDEVFEHGFEAGSAGGWSQIIGEP
ncbi:MAG: hypothetical protein AAGD01_05920 [Acidobacteriota bacterium]